jgi:hypothetical protein
MFFRVWPGFPDSFPFDRFNRLSDEELDPALQSYATELAQNPEVQDQVKRDQKAFVDRLREAQKKFLSRGSEPLGAFPARKLDKLTLWRDVLNCVHHPCGGEIPEWSPGGRVWFYEATSQEFAEELIIELNKFRNLDYRRCQAEIELTPRYGLVSADELSAGQQAAIRRCVQAIRDGKEPAVPNGEAALVLGKKAIQVAKELSSAWHPATPDQATTNSGSTPTGKTNEGEGGGGVGATTTTKKKRRRRKPDPKVVERRAERAKQAKIDKEILADWRKETWGEYQNYVDWKNENLPDGWPTLDRSYVEHAIGREKARLKRLNEWPPK